MLETEEKISDKKLAHMADMYQIDIRILRDKLPYAEEILHKRLLANVDMYDTYET